MVTTFSARLLSIADGCKPIVGSRRVQSHNRQLHQLPQRQTSSGLESQGTPKTSNPPYKSAMKQHRHPRQQDRPKHDSASAKRKRQREEGAYAAAIVKKSLADAGRPPVSRVCGHRGAFKFHGVGIKVATDDGARVMSSKDWDRADATTEAAADASVGTKRRRPNETAEDNNVHGEGVGDEQEKQDEEQHVVVSYDVSNMYALADLIQSTRRYYNFSDGENHNINGNSMLSRLDHSSDDKLSENSEGQSSWTPSVTFGSEMTLGDLNEKKGLDDDNRSDGPSLEDGSETGGEMDSTDGESCRKEGKVFTEPVAVVG
ncbi:hypothetical protein ACHAWF_006810 [Thalassiosira exigua]